MATVLPWAAPRRVSVGVGCATNRDGDDGSRITRAPERVGAGQQGRPAPNDVVEQDDHLGVVPRSRTPRGHGQRQGFRRGVTRTSKLGLGRRPRSCQHRQIQPPGPPLSEDRRRHLDERAATARHVSRNRKYEGRVHVRPRVLRRTRHRAEHSVRRCRHSSTRDPDQRVEFIHLPDPKRPEEHRGGHAARTRRQPRSDRWYASSLRDRRRSRTWTSPHSPAEGMFGSRGIGDGYAWAQARAIPSRRSNSARTMP